MERIINSIWLWIMNFRNQLLLVVIALFWLFLLSYTIQLKPQMSIIGDDWSYVNALSSLYFAGLPDEGRPFGIAAIYGFPLLFTDNIDIAVNWGLTLNLCSWLVSILVVHQLLLERLKDEFRAFAFALFYLLCVGNLAIAFHFLPEPIFILLLLFAVLQISRFELTKKTRHLSAAIAILLFAAMVKPVAIGIAILVAVFYFRSLKSVAVHKSSLMIYPMLVLIAVQMIAMKNEYGDYKISYIGNITYYNYLGAKADCYRKNIEFVPGENERAKHFQSFSSHDQEKIVRDDMIEQLTNNTGNLLKAYGYCLYNNSSKGSFIVSDTLNYDFTWYFDKFQFFFKALSKVQNIALTVIGILLSGYFWMRRRTTSGFAKILALLTLYIFFISGMSCFQTDRFHIVFFPFVIMMLAEFRYNKKILPAEK